MKISDFLSSTDVTTDVVASDKHKLLEELARNAGAVLDVPPDHILSELLKREELGSTGMGGGVAIPHARFYQVEKPFGMLARLRKPIDFDAVDGNPVDTVFLLLLPDAPAGERLGALACIARKLRNPAIIAALRRARDSAEIYRLLTAD
jgi:nitrogen PTS system EIIA component